MNSSKPVNSANDIASGEDNIRIQSSEMWQVMISSNHDQMEERAIAKGPTLAVRGREVLLAIAVFFLLTLAIGLIACLTGARGKEHGLFQGNGELYSTNDSTAHKELSSRYCLTRHCLEAAADMMAKMDSTADPCDNFYRYACGQWLDDHDVPSHKSAWGVDDVLESRIQEQLTHVLSGDSNKLLSTEKKAQLLFRKCVDTEAIDTAANDPLYKVIQSVGGWAIDDDFRSHSWDFITVLSTIHSVYDVDILFRSWLGPDDKFPEQDILQFDQGGLGLPYPSQYFQSRSNPDPKVLPAYQQFLTATAVAYGATSDLATEFAFEVIQFEKSLAEIFVPEDAPERQDANDAYNRLTIAGMNTLCPAINWTKFLIGCSYSVNENTTILVASPSYFSRLSTLIRKSQERSLNYYFIWHLIQKFIYALPTPYRKAESEFEFLTKGTSSSKDRKQVCIRIVDSYFALAMSSLFVRRHFAQSDSEEIVQITNLIRASFKRTLNNYTLWLDEHTRPAAVRKLEQMKVYVGYPDTLKDSAQVDKMHSNLAVNERDKFLEAILALVKANKQTTVNTFNTGTRAEGDNEWLIKPHEVNAIYSLLENSLTIPAGILQPPFYTPNVPRYLNYGRIGAIIGHEMIHGFDLQGSQYDADGSLHTWWSEESRAEFVRRSLCLENHYNNLELSGFQIDGERTLGENMADIAGLMQSYRAYKRLERESGADRMMPGFSLNNDQMFFLAYAQNWCKHRRPQNLRRYINENIHAPEEIRVQGVLMQIEPFANIFQCKEGSALRIDKGHLCPIWI